MEQVEIRPEVMPFCLGAARILGEATADTERVTWTLANQCGNRLLKDAKSGVLASTQDVSCVDPGRQGLASRRAFSS